jgi:glutamate--cysteine ligase
MSTDVSSDEPIESRDQLVRFLTDGAKPDPRDWRIGTEHEKFGFHLADLSPVAYEGETGIKALLEGMRDRFGWIPVEEGGTLIGLKDAAGGAISLEPGGQFELSGAPLETLHDTCAEVNAHLAQVREVATPLGLGFLGLGFAPLRSLPDSPVMPKGRYRIMANYMPKVGTMGLDMMFRTATVQVNLDFASEADMVEKMRVSLALQPIATALFANSPFTEGRPNGFLSLRAEVWRNLDADRTGLIPFVFESGFGFQAYVEWALDVPMYFVKRGDTYYDATGITFRHYLQGGMEERLPGVVPNMGDWASHLTTLFPEVRLKKYIEMRGADGGPWRRLCALPALWTGLLYDADCQKAAWDLCKDWSAEQRDALRAAVPRRALAAEIAGRSARDIARDMLDIAREGLRRRARLDRSGDDETRYLVALEDIVALGRTPAEELLAAYHGPWGGKIEPLFREHAY